MNNKVTLEKYVNKQYDLTKRFLINASISNIDNTVEERLLSNEDILTLIKKEVN